MLTWIIDDFGRIYRSKSPELTSTMGYTLGGPTVERYAIENMGYVGIAERGGKTHIQCRPAVIAQKAVACLFYWLLDHAKTSVVISWMDDIWHMERPVPVAGAISFIGHLLEKPPVGRTETATRVLSKPSETARQRWQTAAREAMAAVFDRAAGIELRQTLDHSFQGRWTLVELNLASKQALMIDRGDCYPPLTDGMVGPRKGFDFQSLSDFTYRDWLLTAIVNAANSNRPLLEDVDAYIEWQRTGLLRTRYWRIVAPLYRNDESCTMLLAAGDNSSIDLRPDRIQIPA